MRVSSMVAAGDMKRCRSTWLSALSLAAKPVQVSHVQTDSFAGFVSGKTSRFYYTMSTAIEKVWPPAQDVLWIRDRYK